MAANDARVLWRTLWLPGIALFLAVAAPWYVAIQIRNPTFFRTFILEHNVARFSSNLYHHRQPFWFYGPVILVALMPWTVFVLAAAVRTARLWWSERLWRQNSDDATPENALSLFALIWLVVPLALFSVSQSKLPAYILPAVPAGALLLVEYIRQNIEELGKPRPPRWLVVLHSLVAAAPVFPALLVQYLVTQHRIPPGKPLFAAAAISAVLAIVVVMTVSSKLGIRALRFATMIPVVFAVGALLKLGSGTVDEYLSARSVALDIQSHQPHPMPLAVQGVRREIDYGLAFYRNQPPLHLDSEAQPQGEYLLVVPHDSIVPAPDRRALQLGTFEPQHLDSYWILPAGRVPPTP